MQVDMRRTDMLSFADKTWTGVITISHTTFTQSQ